MKKIVLVLLSLILNLYAEELTQEDLIGEWKLVAFVRVANEECGIVDWYKDGDDELYYINNLIFLNNEMMKYNNCNCFYNFSYNFNYPDKKRGIVIEMLSKSNGNNVFYIYKQDKQILFILYHFLGDYSLGISFGEMEKIN